MIDRRLLDGKNVLITGCARGIGRAMLEGFTALGANVWAHARQRTPEFEERCAELASEHCVVVLPVYFDITRVDEVKAALNLVMKSEWRINALVNNAGVIANALCQMTPESSLREQMEVNFFGTYLLTQKVVKLLVRNGGGAVVNVASTAALDGNAGRAAYGASKNALIAATRALSREVGTLGVRANALAPGVTDTDMIGDMTADVIAEAVADTDLRRVGRPSEIAGVAAYLVSDLSSYVTGQVLRVDGGM